METLDHSTTPTPTGHTTEDTGRDTWTLSTIPITLIDQGAQLIRHDQHDEEITELAADIARNGLLQPIGVRPAPNGRFQLLFGARRLLAHLAIGRKTIQARVITDTDAPVKTIAARENMLRRNLSLAEECDVVSDLHFTQNLSPDAISHLLGRSRAWILRRLAVPALPDDLKEPVLDGSIKVGTAEAIALLDDPATRALVLNQAVHAKATVHQVRAMVDALRASPDFDAAVAAGTAAAQRPVLPQQLYASCAACGNTRPLEQLQFVRICNPSCPTEGENNNGNPTG